MFRSKPTEKCMDLKDYIMNPQYKENPMKHTNNDSTDTTYSRITYKPSQMVVPTSNIRRIRKSRKIREGLKSLVALIIAGASIYTIAIFLFSVTESSF